MRKVILLVMVTLDGFFDGPGEGLEKIDWHHADEEWEDYSVEILSSADTLTQHGLIDEYRIAVNPVVLGDGTPLFKEHGVRRNLRLLGTRIFTSGIVELRYAQAEA